MSGEIWVNDGMVLGHAFKNVGLLSHELLAFLHGTHHFSSSKFAKFSPAPQGLLEIGCIGPVDLECRRLIAQWTKRGNRFVGDTPKLDKIFGLKHRFEDLSVE